MSRAVLALVCVLVLCATAATAVTLDPAPVACGTPQTIPTGGETYDFTVDTAGAVSVAAICSDADVTVDNAVWLTYTTTECGRLTLTATVSGTDPLVMGVKTTTDCTRAASNATLSSGCADTASGETLTLHVDSAPSVQHLIFVGVPSGAATFADVSLTASFSAQDCFAPLATLATSSFPRRAILTDLDSDGDEDIVVVGTNLAWFENTDGNGDFASAQVIDTSVVGHHVVAGDFDSDGDIDLLVRSTEFSSLVLYSNNGDGTFATETRTIDDRLSGVDAVSAVDLDDDLDTDLVYTLENHIVWVENLDGAGTFGTPIEVGYAKSGFTSMRVTDFDRDGDLDVVAASNEEIVWFENVNGTVQFADGVVLVAAHLTDFDSEATIHIGDMNGDGMPDVVVVTKLKVTWWRRTAMSPAALAFTETTIRTVAQPESIVISICDLDNDNVNEIVYAQKESSNVVWMENVAGNGLSWNEVPVGSVDDTFELWVADVQRAGASSVIAIGNRNQEVVLFNAVLTPETHPVAGDSLHVYTDRVWLNGALFTARVSRHGTLCFLVEAGTCDATVAQVMAQQYSTGAAAPSSASKCSPLPFVNDHANLRPEQIDFVASFLTAGTSYCMSAVVSHPDRIGRKVTHIFSTPTANANANLIDLEVDGAPSSPGFFHPYVNTYYLPVPATLVEVTVRTTSSQNAGVTLTRSDDSSTTTLVGPGSAERSLSFNWTMASLTFDIEVTAADAMDSQTYTVHLLRMIDVPFHPTEVLFNPSRQTDPYKVNGVQAASLKYIRFALAPGQTLPNNIQSAYLHGSLHADLTSVLQNLPSGSDGDVIVAYNARAFRNDFDVPSAANVIEWDLGGDLWADANHDGVTFSLNGVDQWEVKFDPDAFWAPDASGAGSYISSLNGGFAWRAAGLYSSFEVVPKWQYEADARPGFYYQPAKGAFPSTMCVGTSYQDCGLGVSWSDTFDRIEIETPVGPTSVIERARRTTKSLALLDVDLDGDLDAVVAIEGDGQLRWYENDGKGQFINSYRILHTPSDSAWSIFVSDVDGDGIDDLVVSFREPTYVEFLRNDGSGEFTTRVRIDDPAWASYRATYVHGADIDGDGHVDVVSGHESGIVLWHRNINGTAMNWETHAVQVAGGLVTAIFCADMDDDGNNDIVSIEYGGNLRVFLNPNGDGTDLVTVAVADIATDFRQVTYVHAADLNRDGLNDIIVGSGDEAIGSVWFENTGTASTWNRHKLPGVDVGAIGRTLPVDLDNDGDLDVVVVSDSRIYWSEWDDVNDVFLDYVLLLTLPGTTEMLFIDVGPIDEDGHKDLLIGTDGVPSVLWVRSDGAAQPSFSAYPLADATEDSHLPAPVPGFFTPDAIPDFIVNNVWDPCGAIMVGVEGAVRLDREEVECLPSSNTGGLPSSGFVAGKFFSPAGALDDFGVRDTVSSIKLFRNLGNGSFAGPITIGASSVVDRFEPLKLTTSGLDDLVFYELGSEFLEVVQSLGTSFATAVPVYAHAGGAITAWTVLPDRLASAANKYAVLVAGRDELSITLAEISLSSSEVLGTFAVLASRPEINPNGEITAMEVGDFDGDLVDDVLFIHGFDLYFVSRLSTDVASIGFAEKLTPTGFVQGQLSIVDLNGDGHLDVISSRGSTVRALFGSVFITAATEHAVHIIDELLDLRQVVAGDFDGDGDTDLVAVAEDTMRSYVNMDGEGTFAAGVTIDSLVGSQYFFQGEMADLDGDNRADLIVISKRVQFDLSYYTTATGASWTRQTIASVSEGSISLDDFDGDGDVDVIHYGSSNSGGSVAWYENDGAGGTWTRHTVMASLGSSLRFGTAANVDGDAHGWRDIIVANRGFNTLDWLHNDNGTWSEHEVADNVDLPYLDIGFHMSMCAADFDGDGDMDFASAGYIDSRVMWFENVDGVGGEWAEHVVHGASPGVANIDCVDYDNDGDVDIVAGSAGFLVSDLVGSALTWYANDGDGDFAKHLIDRPHQYQTMSEIRSVAAVRINSDNDTDVAVALNSVGALPASGRVAWYESRKLVTPDSSATLSCPRLDENEVYTAIPGLTPVFECYIISRQDGHLINALASDFEISVTGSGQDMIARSPVTPPESSLFSFSITSFGTADVVLSTRFTNSVRLNFSAPRPVLRTGSLTLLNGAGTAEENSIVLSEVNSVRLSLQVDNAGTVPSAIRITYGPIGDLERYTCELAEINGDGVTVELICDTEGGEFLEVLEPLYFKVQVAAQATDPADSDSLVLAEAPHVRYVRGCDSFEADVAVGCPLRGHVTLSVYGQRFDVNGTTQILVNSRLCRKTLSVPPNYIECQLPPSEGGLQLITPYTVPEDNCTASSILYGAPRRLVSYRRPEIEVVRGCDDTSSLTHLKKCHRSNNPTITITGRNFGVAAAGMRATVGGLPCTNLQDVLGFSTVIGLTSTQGFDYINDLDLASVTCDLPVGSLADQEIVLYDISGRSSVGDKAYVTYEQCPAGYFAQGTDCYACPRGQYTDTPGMTACLECELGHFANSTASPTCEPCEPGFAANQYGQAVCDACPRGMFQGESGSSSCVLCAPGKFRAEVGGDVCDDCDAGRFTAFAGMSTCDFCDVGTHQVSDGSSHCVQCAVGRFAPNVGLDTECPQCPLGNFSATPGSSSCDACPLGTHGPSLGLSICQACEPGRFAPVTGLQETCMPCTNGTFSDVPGADSCDNCPQGRYQPSQGLSTCVACEIGRFSNGEGVVDGCQLCPEGTEAPVPGADACTGCPAGTHHTALRTKCVDCELGRFSNESSQAECLPCAKGQFAFVAGQTVCDDCPVGRFNPREGQILCEPCEVGKFADTNGTIESCELCGEGHYSPGLGATECDECPPGTWGTDDGLSACNLCAPGSFNKDTGVTICEQCGLGNFTDLRGESSCEQCGLGRFAPSQGLSSCVECARGRFANVVGSAETCEQCPLGRFMDLTGATECVECPEGRFADALGLSTCKLCEPGRFSNENGTETRCEPCPVNSYAQLQGALSCDLCPAGRFTSMAGEFACEDCPPGRYSNTTGGECLPCGHNMYNYLGAQNECWECPPLSFTGDPDTPVVLNGSTVPPELLGHTSCSTCDVGKYVVFNNDAQPGDPDRTLQECVDCPPGAECDGTGAVQAQTGVWVVTNPSGRVESFSCPPGRCVSCDEDNTGGGDDTKATACCAPNRMPVERNPMCARCAENYVEWGGDCIECSKPNPGLLFLLIILMWATVVFMHVFMFQNSNPITWVFLYYVQMVLLLFGEETEWLAWSSVFNFNMQNVAGGQCIAPWSPVKKMSLTALLPLAAWGFLALTALLHSVSNSVNRRQGKGIDVRELVIPYLRSAVALFIFTFHTIFNTSVRFFSCVDVADGEWRVVRSNPDIDCDSDEYKAAQPLFVFALALASGFIALVAFLLQRPGVRAMADDPDLVPTPENVSEEAGLSSLRLNFSNREIWSVLFSVFKGESKTVAYHWTVVMMCRRVLVIITTAFVLGYNGPTRYAAATTAHAVNLVLHMNFLPFRDATLDGIVVIDQMHRDRLHKLGYKLLHVNAIETVSLLTLVAISGCLAAAELPLTDGQSVGFAAVVYAWMFFLLFLIVWRYILRYLAKPALNKNNSQADLARNAERDEYDESDSDLFSVTSSDDEDARSLARPAPNGVVPVPRSTGATGSYRGNRFGGTRFGGTGVSPFSRQSTSPGATDSFRGRSATGVYAQPAPTGTAAAYAADNFVSEDEASAEEFRADHRPGDRSRSSSSSSGGPGAPGRGGRGVELAGNRSSALPVTRAKSGSGASNSSGTSNSSFGPGGAVPVYARPTGTHGQASPTNSSSLMHSGGSNTPLGTQIPISMVQPTGRGSVALPPPPPLPSNVGMPGSPNAAASAAAPPSAYNSAGRPSNSSGSTPTIASFSSGSIGRNIATFNEGIYDDDDDALRGLGADASDVA